VLAVAKKERAQVAELRLPPARPDEHGRLLVVAVPTTYYNEAGMAAAALVKRYGIDDPAKVVVVHDELDLPIGKIKVKAGGGLAGNNGLKSIKGHLGTDAFLRVRIGVGKPPGSQQGRDHVLRRPGKRDREALDVAIAEAGEAVERILAEGVEAAMQHHNRR
jgi:PTH1 family peptidyl-tRNA hydrolase